MRVRLGKDITLYWEILTDGEPTPLAGRDLQLEMRMPSGVIKVMPFVSQDNVLTTQFYGKDQIRPGIYGLSLWENKGGLRQNVVDCPNAFQLVPTTDLEDYATPDNITHAISTLTGELRSNFSGTGTGGGGIIYDGGEGIDIDENIINVAYDGEGISVDSSDRLTIVLHSKGGLAKDEKGLRVFCGRGLSIDDEGKLYSLADAKADEALGLAEQASQSAIAANGAAENATQYASGAIESANRAQEDANKAQEAADQAQREAKAAADELASWLEDGVISPAEKRAMLTEKARVEAEFVEITTDCVKYDIEVSGEKQDETYAAYERYKDAYIAEIDEILEITGPVDGTKLQEAQAEYYNRRTDILGKISTSAKQRADNAMAKAEEAAEVAKAANGAMVNLSAEMQGINGSIADFNRRLDGVVENYFLRGKPTLNGEPYKSWSDSDKLNHVGDTYTNINEYIDVNEVVDTDAGKSWRWCLCDEESVLVEGEYWEAPDGKKYHWHPIADSDAVKALLEASKALSAADRKARTFVRDANNPPEAPYDKGDLWLQGGDGEIYVCETPRTEDEKGSEQISDWVKACGYTSNAEFNEFITGDYATRFQELQYQVDQKAQTWYQDTDPSGAWLIGDIDKREQHVGDLWYDTGRKKNFVYEKVIKAGIASYVWSEIDGVPDDVYDLIDGTSNIFYTKNVPPPPYNEGDLWSQGSDSILRVCVQARTKDESPVEADWKPADNTAEEIAKAKEEAEKAAKQLVGDLEKVVQNQLDHKAEMWYQEDDPSVDWTDGEKPDHEGDLWCQTPYNKSYIYTLKEGKYVWETLDGVPESVYDTLDGKSQIFYLATRPNPPYYKGDLWSQGASSILRVSKEDRESDKDANGNPIPSSTLDADWVEADDTSKQIKELSEKTEALIEALRKNVEEQLDKKAEMWYQEGDPSEDWEKSTYAEHEGDMWYKISTGVSSIWGKDSNGSYLWTPMENIPQELYDAIDGKSQIFYGTYFANATPTNVPKTPYYKGDLWSKGTTDRLLVCWRDNTGSTGNIDDWEPADNTKEEIDKAKDENKSYTDDLIDSLSSGTQNLVRNSGFTGAFEVIGLQSGTTLKAVFETFSPKLDFWAWSNAGAENNSASQTGKVCSFWNRGGYIEQPLTYGIKTETDYVLSFIAYGYGSLIVFFGGQQQTITLTNSWKRYSLKFTTFATPEYVNDILRFESDVRCWIGDIIATQGNIIVDWAISPYDNQSVMAKFEESEYLKNTLRANTSIGDHEITTGLVNAGIISMGEFDTNGDKVTETAGLNGVYNDEHDVAFWGGGTLQQAIKSVQMYRDDPTKTPTKEELALMAKVVITHGGRAILEDAIVRGSIYAENGYFKGRVEANEGVFNGTVYARNGRFDGIVKSRLSYSTTKYIDDTDFKDRKYKIEIDSNLVGFTPSGFFVVRPTTTVDIDEFSHPNLIELPKAADYDGLELSFFVPPNSNTDPNGNRNNRWLVAQENEKITYPVNRAYVKDTGGEIRQIKYYNGILGGGNYALAYPGLYKVKAIQDLSSSGTGYGWFVLEGMFGGGE